MDISLALMTGVDIPIPECQLILHQPTLKEISMIGEQDFFIGAHTLCINKLSQKDIPELEHLSNFGLLMLLFQQDKSKKSLVKEVLILLFPKYKVLITPRSICFNNDEVELIIDEGNFESFQKVLRQVFCLQLVGKDSFNPKGKKASEIAQKLLRARERVAAQKQDKSNSLATYISVITVGVASMSLQDTINLTMYQLYDLLERYGLYISWDIDIKSRLAGASPDDKPDSWMKSIH